MKEKALQYLADKIIVKLQNTTDDDMFQFYYEIGIWLDNVAINYFNIFLK